MESDLERLPSQVFLAVTMMIDELATLKHASPASPEEAAKAVQTLETHLWMLHEKARQLLGRAGQGSEGEAIGEG